MGQETEKSNADICKDFHKLMKNIKKLSDSQATVTEWKEENLKWFKVEICPNGGLYHGGKFVFKVFPCDYPTEPPIVRCLTRVYHPNIDPEYDYDQLQENDGVEDDENCEEYDPYTNVCVSLLAEDWEPHFTFEDCIQSLLFLFYEPNIDDPLSPLIDSGMDFSGFEMNVKRSLLGLAVDSCFEFERNYSLDDFDKCMKAISNEVVEENELDKCDVTQDSLSDMNSFNLEIKNTANSDPSNKEDEVIEKLPDGHEKLSDGISHLASVDLISEVDLFGPMPLIVNALPDVVHFSLENPAKPTDAVCDNRILFSESRNLVNAEVPSMERPVNCDNIGAPSCLTIERDSKLGANMIIDGEDGVPDLPTQGGPLHKCISATMWMVKFVITQIIPEIYKS